MMIVPVAAALIQSLKIINKSRFSIFMLKVNILHYKLQMLLGVKYFLPISYKTTDYWHQLVSRRGRKAFLKLQCFWDWVKWFNFVHPVLYTALDHWIFMQKKITFYNIPYIDIDPRTSVAQRCHLVRIGILEGFCHYNIPPILKVWAKTWVIVTQK